MTDSSANGADDAPREARGRSAVGAVFLFLLALTVLKGIRMPNRWAVTHYLFSYETGFMKRGLWGEVLRRLFGQWTASYFFMAGVGLAIFAATVCLIVRECRRLPAGSDRLAFFLVFFASPALTFSAHMVGYLEQVAYLGWLPVLALRRHWRAQLGVAIAIAAVLPLVHEASGLWVGALTGLALLTSPDGRARPRARLVGLAVVCMVWIGSAAAVTVFGRVSAERAAAIRDDRTEFFSIRPRQDAFATLTVPLRDSLADMRVRWKDPDAQADMAFSLAVYGPAGLFLGVLAVRRARALPLTPELRAAVLGLTLLAIVGPLLLHFVGWDRHRWNALATLNAGLAALALLSAPATPAHELARQRSGTVPALALAVCLWSVSADPVLFDLYGPAHPPFAEKIQFLIEAIQTGNAEMWIPLKGN